MKRCGVRYGERRQLPCRRLAGHRGQHGKQMTVTEVARVLKARRRS